MTAGEATREFYREQGRQQERQRMTETEAIRENYNLGVIAGEARERQRIMTIINNFHAGKTHHLGATCWVCDLITELEGEQK